MKENLMDFNSFERFTAPVALELVLQNICKWGDSNLVSLILNEALTLSPMQAFLGTGSTQ